MICLRVAVEPAVKIVRRVPGEDIEHLARGSIHRLKRPGLSTLAFPEHQDLAGMVSAVDHVDLFEVLRALLPVVPDQLMQRKHAVSISESERELSIDISEIAEIAPGVHLKNRIILQDVRDPNDACSRTPGVHHDHLAISMGKTGT